ncbi:MAG: hypothetical protein M3O70_00160 [Actinomycetota bacterium]|nr:hypothetical protein [Actinomycetota bacterium]
MPHARRLPRAEVAAAIERSADTVKAYEDGRQVVHGDLHEGQSRAAAGCVPGAGHLPDQRG